MSERSAVKNPMLRYADAIGWTYISPDEALKELSKVVRPLVGAARMINVTNTTASRTTADN